MITLCWQTPCNYVDKNGCYMAFFCWKWYPERGRRGIIRSKFLKITFLLYQCQFLDPSWVNVHLHRYNWDLTLCRRSIFFLEDQPNWHHGQVPLWWHLGLVVAVGDTHGKGVRAGWWHGVASNTASPSPSPVACASWPPQSEAASASLCLTAPDGLVILVVGVWVVLKQNTGRKDL